MDFGFLVDYPRVLLDAALLTIALSLAALVGGGILGLLVALARLLGGRVVDTVLGLVVDVIRGTPLLVQLMVWYLGPALVRIEVGDTDIRLELSPFAAAAIGLSVNAAAFISEIIRGAIRSLPAGQREATAAIGLTRRYSVRAIELPQAAPIMFPALVSFYLGLIKDTSVAYIVGLHELLRTGQLIADFERRPLEIYLTIGLVYFTLCFPLSRLAARLERRHRSSGLVQERLFI
jgi:polar amino acid transport system permease protein